MDSNIIKIIKECIESQLFANLCSAFSAIGTVGAVIVSLFLSSKKDKPNIKVDKNEITIGNKNFFSIYLYNNDIHKEYSIKEIGYPNLKEKRWNSIALSKLQCKKKDYTQIVDGKYKCVECCLNEKFCYGQELYIILKENDVRNMINSNNKRSVKISIIFLGESKICLKVSKKYLEQYIK